jgi:hypothetical protein
LKKRIEDNELKRVKKYASDETLASYLAPRQMLKDGIKMLAADIVNKVLPAERVITFPL